jgi:hypothetical protein
MLTLQTINQQPRFLFYDRKTKKPHRVVSIDGDDVELEAYVRRDTDVLLTFEEALPLENEQYGIGINLGDGLVGIDFDDCVVSGRIKPEVLNWIERFGTYAERSPSGRGIHIMIRSNIDTNQYQNKTQVDGIRYEQYSRDRYFTYTRDPYHEADIRDDIDDVLEEFLKQNFKPKQEPKPRQHNDARLDADAVIDLLDKEPGDKFTRLFRDGDMSEYHDDHSSADQALCCKIAFYTQDPNTIEEVFGRSALVRDKWTDRQNYRDMTIQKALDTVGDNVYTPPGKKVRSRVGAGPNKPAPTPTPDDDIETLLELDKKFFTPRPDNQPPVKLDAITFNDVSFAKPGHVSVIKGLLKAGKSNVCGALVTAILNTPDDDDDVDIDTLGFRVNQGIVKNVLYLDVEQDHEDVWTLYHGVYKRWKSEPIDYDGVQFKGTRGFTVEERKQYLELVCRYGLGGVKFDVIVIDTVRGFLYNFNDVAESAELLNFLERLTVQYGVAIVATIHKNPSQSSGGKSMGHIGTMLEQQAYCVLDVSRSTVKDQVHELQVQYARRGRAGDDTAVYFEWTTEPDGTGLFKQTERPTKEAKHNGKLSMYAAEVLTEPISYGDFQHALVQAGHYTTNRGAQMAIRAMKDNGIVVKEPGRQGKYRLWDPTVDAVVDMEQYDDDNTV